jgi:hypothetical protein
MLDDKLLKKIKKEKNWSESTRVSMQNMCPGCEARIIS